MFWALRAIWEGAGTVRGRIGGRDVQGRARLELNGYGYVFDIRKNLREFGERVESQIESFLPRTIDQPQLEKYVGPPRWRHEPGAYTETLSKPVWDLLERRGKRWRPAFSLLLMEALGVPSRPYEKLLSVIPELSHTGALIIDDIEDKSKLRRGDACTHLRYGTDVAVNAGNTLYFLPYLLLAQEPLLSERQRLRMYEMMVQQFVSAHFGQGLDIYWSKNLNRRNLARWLHDSMGEKILQMYSYKTAASLEAGASACCIISRADARTRNACISFAHAFGVAFQIVDDIHNFSDSPQWTKTCGEDIASGKLTYVIWQAIKRLPPAGRDRLQRILCSPALRRDPEGLAEGIGLVRDSGALPACRQEAKSMVEREWERLSRRLASSEPKIMLRLLCDHLLDLSFHS
jgi:geranylgeranyl diphosphate synthase type I